MSAALEDPSPSGQPVETAGTRASTELLERMHRAVSSRYLMEREIGRGGTAIVFRGRDLIHQRPVAIKVLRPDLPLSSERFLREILILAGLQHPHIVPLFDSGQAEGLLYFVMPLIEGDSLRSRLARGALPPGDALAIVLEVADALGYAHSRSLVHRDVKPENILLSEGHAIVTDFGIARAIQQSVDNRTTGTGFAIGTPLYMSPEQAAGSLAVDSRSDQYSLATVLYELLSGTPPFEGSTPEAVRARQINGDPPQLRISRSGLPASLEAAIRRALSLDPDDRFDSVEAFTDALVADVPRTMFRTRSGSIRARLFHHSFASRPLRRLLAAGLTLLGLAIAGFLWSNRPPTPAPGPRGALAALDPRRVAVLYFDDHSADASLGYLANGLTESLIHELSTVRSIQVISRNGVKQFRNVAVPLDSVFMALQVGSLVEGSVQQSNDRIRVTVQLVDARTGSHLESATFERPIGELFRLEDDLAREVASLLRRGIGLTIRVRETIAGTTSARARELMFRADQARDEAEPLVAAPDTLERAKGLALLATADSMLREAEQIDRRWNLPVLARGWVALELAARQGGERRVQAFDRAVQHSKRGLGREASAEAHELHGTLLHFQAARLSVQDAQWRLLLDQALGQLELAVAMDSSLATAWGTLSRVRILRGEVDVAERNAEIALAMDAYLRDAPDILVSLYAATLMRGSLNTSWRWCERGAQEYRADPRFVECQLTLLAEDQDRSPDTALALSLVREGNRLDPPAQARAVGRPYLPVYREMLGAIVMARAGDTAGARAVASRLHQSVAADPELSTDIRYEAAYLHLVLGERTEAIRLLSAYLAARPSRAGLVGRHARWRALRDDPAFVSLLRAPGTPGS